MISPNPFVYVHVTRSSFIPEASGYHSRVMARPNIHGPCAWRMGAELSSPVFQASVIRFNYACVHVRTSECVCARECRCCLRRPELSDPPALEVGAGT